MTNLLAVIACLASSALVAFFVLTHQGAITPAVFYLAGFWALMGSLVAGALTPAYWKRLDRTIPQIHADAKRGALPRDPPLARVMNLGALALVLVGMVSLLFY